MTLISWLASAGMAVGPPLVYADQFSSIIRRKDSTGFSMDICANVIRIFFWFGKRFETALLVQSILMIAFQLALLYVCLKYQKNSPDNAHSSGVEMANSATDLLAANAAGMHVSKPDNSSWKRPYDLWQWQNYGTYIEFIGALIGVNTFLYFVLGWLPVYIDIVGLLALGLESTLPIPQLLSNFRRKSLSGFRMTVLAGWVFGDAFKTLYFFFQAGNSWQFKATACFQLSIDLLICGQAYLYRHNIAGDMAASALPTEDLESLTRGQQGRESTDGR